MIRLLIRLLLLLILLSIGGATLVVRHSQAPVGSKVA